MKSTSFTNATPHSTIDVLMDGLFVDTLRSSQKLRAGSRDLVQLILSITVHGGHMRHICKILLATAACLVCSPAEAYDWVLSNAHVVVVEADGMPTSLSFIIDQNVGSCPSTGFLKYNLKGTDEPSQIANAQSMLAVLLTAKASGKSLSIYGNNAGCTVDFIWLTG